MNTVVDLPAADAPAAPQESASQQLAAFAANLKFEDIPPHVVRKAEDLYLDWLGSVLAGKGSRPVESITRFALTMGPDSGPSEVLINRRRSSPLIAAISNAAASHVAEQDDVHNGSVFHPAAVVFAPALAVAQALGSSGRDFLLAAVVGYEVGIRVGEYLGRSHYKIFHTTGTVGPIAAAVAVGSLLKLTPEQMLNAIGSAGTQSAGLWEFLRDAADSKQLHTAHAAGAGLTAAYLAQDGFTGARRILEGAQGMAAGMSSDADITRLTDRLGTRWALPETSFKFHASCRHTHPAADALQLVLRRDGLRPDDIVGVVALVHQGAIDVLGPVTDPQTVHQSKFSMGTVLGLIAQYDRAGLTQFDDSYADAAVAAFRDKVAMQLDPEVDAAYPARWIGKVRVTTRDGKIHEGRVDEPKGDPGNTLSRSEIEQKAIALAAYRGGATEAEMQKAIAQAWDLENLPRVGAVLG
jgi:2-methylcitrate dehydratase PrpD